MQTLTIKTKPVSVNQRYTIARGRNILSSKYRAAKEAIRWEVKAQCDKELLLNDDIALNIIVYYDKRKPDIDAYEKILLDSLTGIVYKDDSQINEKHTFMVQDKKNPRVVIQVL